MVMTMVMTMMVTVVTIMVMMIIHCPFSLHTACLPKLNTLQIAHNQLKTVEDVQELQNCGYLRLVKHLV